MLTHGRRVRRVMVHVVAFADLARAPMAAPVVGNNAVALPEKIKQLCVPVVRAQRPTVMKDKGLRVSGTPVFIEDVHSVRCSDGAHDSLLCTPNERIARPAREAAQDQAYPLGEEENEPLPASGTIPRCRRRVTRNSQLNPY